MANRQAAVTSVLPRDRLHANVLRACLKCGAPGFWHNTPGVNVGCYAPDKITQLGSDPVGTVCPNCGAARPDAEFKPDMWSRTYRQSIWPVLKAATFEVITSIKRRTRR